MQFKEVLAVHGPLVCAYPIVCYYLINFDVVAYEVFFVQGISWTCHEISFSQVLPTSPRLCSFCFVEVHGRVHVSYGVAIQSRDWLVPKVEAHLSMQLLTLRNINE